MSALVLIPLGCAYSQNGSILIGAGYGSPVPPVISAGQVVKLSFSGLGSLNGGYFRQEATTVPLPTAIAGISVSIKPEGSTALPVPLFSVEQIPVCRVPVPECYVTQLAVQIPVELTVQRLPGYAEVIVSQNDKNSVPSRVFVASQDSIHIVNTCDSLPATSEEVPALCRSAVTHGDGTLITSSSPAVPGETVVIYGFGMGKTTPAVKAGELTPVPAPVLSSARIVVDFDFRPNAAPTKPLQSLGRATQPAFAGLTPGQVGLYQINVRLPDSYPAVVACGGAVLSNLTINIAGANTFDGAGVCVTPNPGH